MGAKPKAKSKPTKKKTLTSLYNKASKAMQDYYRTLQEPCYCGCGLTANVIHHHSHWGQSVALRFEERNFVPLNNGCHFGFHNGNFKIKCAYESRMRLIYGQNWEDQLIIIERSHVHQTEKEKREYLANLIQKYKDCIDNGWR